MKKCALFVHFHWKRKEARNISIFFSLPEAKYHTCETNLISLRNKNFLKRNRRTLPLSVAETVICCKDWGRKKAWQNTHSKYTWYTLEVVGVVPRMFILELKKRQHAHNHEYTLLHCIWLNNGHFSEFQIHKVFGSIRLWRLFLKGST